MSYTIIHNNLAQTSSLFVAALGIWAIFLRIRTQPLSGNWFGAAVIGELLLLAQFGLGWWLYIQLGGATLPRPYLHILYGTVAILALPAGYAYFNQLDDENVKSVALAFVCFFLWGILLRASTVGGGFG